MSHVSHVSHVSHPSPACDLIPASFEDFRLGQCFVSEARLVTADDLELFANVSGDRHPLHIDAGYARGQGYGDRMLHGPFGLAGFFGWFYTSGIATDAIVGLLDTQWSYLAPIYIGDAITYEMTITRCQRTKSQDRGVIGRHVRVRNQGGIVVQEGSTAVLVRAQGTAGGASQELMTAAWAGLVSRRLNDDAEFQRATATWDGTVGLAGDRGEVQFRIYRGKVIESGARTPMGPTFTVVASDLVWAELASGPESEFMRRAMQGAFAVRGCAYEYLRLTRAISFFVDAMRDEFQQGGNT